MCPKVKPPAINESPVEISPRSAHPYANYSVSWEILHAPGKLFPLRKIERPAKLCNVLIPHVP
jgi:hypothetical protein